MNGSCVIRLSHGSGDNLSSRDIKNGYCSYIEIEGKVADPSDDSDCDGGELLLKVHEFKIIDYVYDALDLVFGTKEGIPNFIPLELL